MNLLRSDHIGDIRSIPTPTPILLGPYSDSTFIEKPEELSTIFQVPSESMRDRKISTLSGEQAWQTVGSLRGIDYFEDGSLYLLDTPGHKVGHIAAMVCTSTSPEPVYHILGGDAAHHISLIDYENPAAIGVYKTKENVMNAEKDTDPDKLQSFEDDIGTSSQSYKREVPD